MEISNQLPNLQESKQVPGKKQTQKSSDIQTQNIAASALKKFSSSQISNEEKSKELNYIVKTGWKLEFDVLTVFMDTSFSHKELMEIANTAKRRDAANRSLNGLEAYIVNSINESVLEAAMRKPTFENHNFTVKLLKQNK